MRQLIDDPMLTEVRQQISCQSEDLPLFFSKLVMERNKQLTPTQADSFALLNFVTRVRQNLEALVLSPTSFTACVCKIILLYF